MLKKICNLLKKPLIALKKQNFWVQLFVVFLIIASLQGLLGGGLMGGSLIEGLTNSKTVVYFHMNGCPHCADFNPTWSKFVSGNKSGIQTAKIERKEMTKAHKALNITGFPTIVLLAGTPAQIKGGNLPAKKLADFGDRRTRTVDGLNKFISETKNL